MTGFSYQLERRDGERGRGENENPSNSSDSSHTSGDHIFKLPRSGDEISDFRIFTFLRPGNHI
jgi:hypothetical protein